MSSGEARPSGPRWVWVALATVLAVLVIGVAVAVLVLRPLDVGGAPDEGVDTVMPLTGEVDDGGHEAPALAVKVSNSPEARPQTGLEQADVVFEELTEGGITRFLAVFHSRLPEVTGPVRSARPVDAQVIAGFDHPGFAFSGAREEVRAILSATPAVAITEGEPGFFRDPGDYASHPVAPHDLFLELEPALAAVIDGGARPLGDIGWEFDPTPPEGELGAGTSIDIAMSDTSVTSWDYDEGTERYRRSQNGTPTEVTGPERIGAANVVVLDTRHYVGASGYPETDVLGAGDARILRDGRAYAARWSKPTETDPLRLLLADDSAAFPLKPGASWLHLADELPG